MPDDTLGVRNADSQAGPVCRACRDRGYTHAVKDDRIVLTRCDHHDDHPRCECKGEGDRHVERTRTRTDGSTYTRWEPCAWCDMTGDMMRSATAYLRTSGVPKRYAATLVGDLSGPLERHAREMIRAVTDDGSRRGVLYYGAGKGTGKTMAACAVLNELICRTGHNGLFATATGLYEEIKRAMDPKVEETTPEVMRRYVGAWYLILDDLQVRPDSQFQANTVYQLINERYNRKRITIITANLGPDALKRISDGRVWSRIMEMCDLVQVTGRDHRRGRATHTTLEV